MKTATAPAALKPNALLEGVLDLAHVTRVIALSFAKSSSGYEADECLRVVERKVRELEARLLKSGEEVE